MRAQADIGDDKQLSLTPVRKGALPLLIATTPGSGSPGAPVRLAGARFSGDLKKRLTKVLDIYLEHALQNPRLFELMFLKPREGARRYPRDFKAGRSPTANLLAEVVQSGMDRGYFRKGDAWEIVFEMGALSHGLILLYLGGRMAVPPARFRAFYQRSFRRLIHGIRK